MSSPQYETWPREELIARLRHLDATLASVDSHSRIVLPRRAEARRPRKFDISSYPRRKIALKFCYSGWEYNGLVFQSDKTRRPTVEGTLYNALSECKLIDGAAGPQACGWERCGRTDVGVSSASQVISLWVRSNIGQGETPSHIEGATKSSVDVVENVQKITDSDFPAPDPDSELPQLDASEIETAPPAPVLADDGQKQELRYVTIINRVLPPSIRILAWSPVSTSFSSRFSCLHRHYKYFFSPNGLDLDAMRDAAARLVGEHDFRNLCKLDAAKQITNFRRRIIRTNIRPASILGDDVVTSNQPHMCVLDLVGTAFLYNQVRHIMAILFLVGAGLEPPSVVTALLNADPERPEPPFREGEAPPELVTCKPEYQIADPLPLVLWECSYDEKDVKWQTDADGSENGGDAEVYTLYNQLSAIHARSLIHSTLDATFLKAASNFHPPPHNPFPIHPSSRDEYLRENSSMTLNVPLGGGMTHRAAARTYIPLLRRNRFAHVDIVNERWRKGKGERRAARRAEKLDADDE
ncbi:tRNA pseudouridine synthase [Sanghuangporus baumii]|uniref:tRNA pseudouridine synthase n=1 Tax=Sanghuangporus baumii TaxID=108892 RepID=A0A9Q5HU48_SANBA|nr:tRNA pseudouridine synthase [Sanghuangporus baumii]